MVSSSGFILRPQLPICWQPLAPDRRLLNASPQTPPVLRYATKIAVRPLRARLLHPAPRLGAGRREAVISATRASVRHGLIIGRRILHVCDRSHWSASWLSCSFSAFRFVSQFWSLPSPRANNNSSFDCRSNVSPLRCCDSAHIRFRIRFDVWCSFSLLPSSALLSGLVLLIADLSRRHTSLQFPFVVLGAWSSRVSGNALLQCLGARDLFDPGPNHA